MTLQAAEGAGENARAIGVVISSEVWAGNTAEPFSCAKSA
jgi:hypothetical protein